jgi:two-component system response regulator AtoC
MSRILVIDDDKALCRSLEIQLHEEGHEVAWSNTAEEGLAQARAAEPEMIFLDLTLPDRDGLEVLKDLRQSVPQVPVAMITGRQDMGATIEAMRLGAFDYLRKPFALEDLVLLLEKASVRRERRAESGATAAEVAEEHPPYELVGADRAMVEVVKQIGLLSQTEVTVLVTGESGTGKELVARALHEASAPGKPFVAMNCSAVAPTLFESELFGHEKGAFTGAHARRAGKLEQAADGTLFLDEVGDMPLEQQAKLLRVLQEQEFERVGGTQKLALGARVVAATNQDLESQVEAGGFREDLYYRLCVSPIRVPPLRERREDVPLLARHLLARIVKALHRKVEGIDEPAMKRLKEYDWPGNVRELENVLTRAVALSQDRVLRTADFDFSFGRREAPTREEEVLPLAEAEKRHVEAALTACGWNITHTARALEISPTTLRKKINDYELKSPL